MVQELCRWSEITCDVFWCGIINVRACEPYQTIRASSMLRMLGLWPPFAEFGQDTEVCSGYHRNFCRRKPVVCVQVMCWAFGVADKLLLPGTEAGATSSMRVSVIDACESARVWFKRAQVRQGQVLVAMH